MWMSELRAKRFRQGLHHQPDDRRFIAAGSRLRIAAGHRVAGIGLGGRFGGVIELPQMVLDFLLGDADQIQLAADHVWQAVE